MNPISPSNTAPAATGPIPTLKTERLVLRPFVRADIPLMVCFAGSKEVHATTLMIPHPYTEQHAIDWIATHESLAHTQQALIWAIADHKTDALLGAIDLRLTNTHARGEMGYWIGPPHWGKGYATQAVRTVVRHGFETLSLYRIHADHFAANPASGRVMTKAGMKQEGTLRGQFIKDGQHIDTILYAITKPDYAQLNRTAPSPANDQP